MQRYAKRRPVNKIKNPENLSIIHVTEAYSYTHEVHKNNAIVSLKINYFLAVAFSKALRARSKI
jgi:hypothetical protein